jgi:hypothetical protein
MRLQSVMRRNEDYVLVDQWRGELKVTMQEGDCAGVTKYPKLSELTFEL